jgi:hypothetical protein
LHLACAGLLVDVDRGSEGRGTRFLATPVAEIYEACGDTARTPEQVLATINQSLLPIGIGLIKEDIEEILVDLCAMGLTVRDGHQFFSLAIPANTAW